MSDQAESDQTRTSPTPKQWVQFEEGENQQSESSSPSISKPANYSGAVIDTETVQIDIEKVKQQAQTVKPEAAPAAAPVPAASSAARTQSHVLRNVNLDEPVNGSLSHTIVLHTDPTIQRGFANGDVIVTVLPVNHSLPWVTPAEFRPELVPEELMAEGLSLTVEDYVQIVETLVHDVRFTAYNVCYKRLLMAWLITSFVILLGLLFSGAKGLTLFGCGVIWLIINAAAIFVCMWLKNKMNRGLEKAVAKANRTLMRHRILLGVDDRGKLSCHKTHLCFIYFDATDCIRKLQQVIDAEDNANATEGDAAEQRRRREMRNRMDIDDTDIVVAGANTTRISRKQERARLLLLRYIQRWAKAFLRQSLDLQLVAAAHAFNTPARVNGGQPNVLPTPTLPPVAVAAMCTPRHAATFQCPCQFIESHLKTKVQRGKFSLYQCCSLPDFD